MKQTSSITIALLITFVCAQARGLSRDISNFDTDWKFHLGDIENAEQVNCNDKDWRVLDLPHDWSIEGENIRTNPGGGTVGFFPTGIGWYRKEFSMPAIKSDDRYQIEFDGVYMNSTVWVNGKLVKFSISGGEIIGVENSCPDDLMNCKLKERKAFNGMCLAIVQASKKGEITVKAEAEGLVSDDITIYVE